MGSHSDSINCWRCDWEHAVIVYETRPFISEDIGIPDEWGYCNRCGYTYGLHTMGQLGEDYETMKALSDLNFERTEWRDERDYAHLQNEKVYIPMTENLEPYTEKEYKNIIKKYNNSHLIDEYTFKAEGEPHEHGHEHGHEHDEEMDPEDLIYSLDKLTEFAISYIDEGGFGGEPLGREVDKKRDLIIETIRYVEGSIELNIIYDMKENPLSLRFTWTDDDFSPIIYLPPPVFLARNPDEVMDHDH